MPIYEYQCQACGHEFEALQKMSDDPLRDCPSCNQAELKKKVSAAAFRLKGGGWYETDFKSSDKKKNLAGDAAKSDGGSKEPAGSSSDGSGAGSDKSSTSDKGTSKAAKAKPANGS